MKLTMPADVAKIGLSFVLQAKTEDGSKATADIDDVNVEKVAAGASLLSAKNVTKTATAYAEEEVQLYTAMMANRGTALLDCGFEDGEYEGWNMSGIVPTGEDKVSGDKALKLTKGGYVTVPSVAVESGETYTVKGKLKSGADSQGIFWIHQMTAGGGSVSMWNIGYISELGVSTEGWMDVEFDVKIQEGAALLRLDLQANEGDGASYFDELTITKKVPVAGQDKDNLLQNGYFEKKLQNWTFADSGAGSHSIVNTGHEKYGQVLQSKLKEASDQVYGWSEEVAVKANYIYTISYQVKFTPEEKEPTAPYGCIAIIQELNSKGSYTGTPATSQAVNQTNGWKTVSYEYITSADAKTIRMDLMHANIPGTAQWDAVVIKEKGKYTPETLDSKYDHGGTADTKNKANLIANGTFDKGNMSGWNPQEGIKAMATKNTNGGTLRFQIKAGRYFQSNAITVQGESRYALTYYVKGENLTNLDLISYLFYTDEKGTVTGWTDFVQYNVTSVAKEQWKKVSIEFATPKLIKGQTLTLGFKTLHTQKCGWQKTNNDKDCNCTVKGTIYLDDISLIRTGAFKDVGEGKTSANSLISNGEAYLKNSMKMLMTDYTYTVKGKYHGNVDGEAQLRFYDYKGQEYTEERQSVKLSPKGKTFEMTVTAPSNSYSALYIGGKKAGSITLENVTIYMIAKPATSSDWDGFWVWYPENPVDDAVEQYRYFRYEFVLEDDPEYAPLQLTVDDKYALYVNGEKIAENWDAGNDSWANVASYDLTEKVKKGRNVIALKCYNLVSEAGLLFDGKFTLKNKNVQVIASGSDVRSSKSANDKTLDWTKVGYNDSGWKLVREYGQPPCSPWGPVFYDSSLYIHNAATVVSTKVPEKVTSGKTLEFEVTLKLDSPIESKFTPVVTIYKRNSLTSVTSAPMELLNYENTLEWPVGEEFTLKASVEIPDYVESGKYQIQMDSNMLLLSGEEVYDNKFLSFEAWASATGRDPITSSIEEVNGTPTLLINGEPQAAHFYNRPDLNVYLQTDAETRLYKSDLELYITYGGSLYKGGCDPIWLEDGSIDYDVFDGVIYETLGNNSNALAMVNIGMFAPTWWMEQNPDEVVTSHDGENYIKADDVSFASEKFRKEASEVLRQLLQHMKEQSYYNRIYGIKLTAGHTYEWMTWGTGDGYGPDYSKASQEGFKKYLKKVYKTNAALQKAWGNSKVTFENAAAPSWNARSASERKRCKKPLTNI